MLIGAARSGVRWTAAIPLWLLAAWVVFWGLTAGASWLVIWHVPPSALGL